MEVAVGIDVAKEFHWAIATRLDPGTGKAAPVLNRRVENAPADIAAMTGELLALAGGDSIQVGIDMVGGIAKLLEVMLTHAGLEVVHVPGKMVKNARQATRGGEHKSDPRDARVIADQVRARDDLRLLTPISELDAQLGLLVARRSDLVRDQTRRISRLRDLLCSIHPGLERVVDPSNKADLVLLTRYVTPAEIRRAGKARIAAHLHRSGGRYKTRNIDALADAAVSAAREQIVTVPAETTAAAIVKDLAEECLVYRGKIATIDTEIAEVLERHPDAALIATLPGMGAVLTAELLAVAGGLDRFTSGDHLAAAAGLAPALVQSGKVRYLHRPLTGDRALKRVFYQSAFCAIPHDPASRAFYDRKRTEGKRHHQALIALARRRINVLYAMLRDRQPYQPRAPKVA